MKYVYMLLSGLLLALVLLFALQNITPVTIKLLDMSLTAPLAVLIVLVYLLGMFTGGFVMAMFRRLLSGTAR